MLIDGQQHRTIWVSSGLDAKIPTISILDQTKLPHSFEIARICSLHQMVDAIKTMQVRGAPLIGAAAAYGMALAAVHDCEDATLLEASQLLISSRPTAVNLKWAVQRMLDLLLTLPVTQRKHSAWAEASSICDEDIILNQAIGGHGLDLIEAMYSQHSRTINILTHCNAGWLATVDFGTALAPIYAAHDAGIAVHVWVDETRPRNQGASLTAWELGQHGVPHTVISDNAGGHLMQKGAVDMVIVGADRVSAVGDVCNKIGTYLKALAAFDNKIPFYAAVPSPTIDWSIENGLHEIEIEERDSRELEWMNGRLKNGDVTEVNILPPDTKVANPAFDVTPARLVTGIITEQGVFSPHTLHKIKKIS